MKKKIEEITYRKKDGGISDYSVFLLANDLSSISGFSVGAMSQEDKESLVDIQEKYEGELNYFMKYYRKFSLVNILTQAEGE